jgi:uncharacterized protein (TIGR03435 family)
MTNALLRAWRSNRGLRLIAAAWMILAPLASLAQVSAGENSSAPPSHDARVQQSAFEVASIRPSNAGSDLHNFMISPNRFRVENGTVASLIKFAYHVKSDDQLPKEPRWIGLDKFDIDAKIADLQAEAIMNLPPDQKFEQYRSMVRSLLMDRFKLAIIRQSKELPVLALVVAKNGPKLTPAKGSLDPRLRRMPTLTGGSRGELKAGAASMAFFTDWLSGRDDLGGRLVIDETGLPGSYDFALSFTPDETRNASLNGAGTSQGAAGAQESPGGSILTALQEQLGLKLKPARAKVDTLVVDHIEKPSAN